MFFQKKDWRERSIFFNRIRMLCRTLLGIFLAFSFTWFFFETIENVHPESTPESVGTKIEISRMEDAEKTEIRPCPEGLSCIDTSTPFLSQPENEEVFIINSEDFNSDLAVRMLNPEEDDATINDIAEMDKIEETYEEELPSEAYLDEEEMSDAEAIRQYGKDYHIYHGHRSIREMGVLPSKRPLYFGPQPVVAVVIDDMGISPKRTADIISLKAPLTSSFLTYARKLPEQVAAARSAGHEIMIHVPMQAKSNKDAAPDVLTTKMPPEEIRQRLEAMLSKFDGVKGINNHMGSLFTEDSERLGAVMEVLKEHGLFFLDSKTSPRSVGRVEAGKHGVVYAHRHVFLDNENNVDYINGQLRLTERIARKNGYAVAIGHPKSGTFQALAAWLPELEKKGIKLVPMSKIVEVTGIPQ